MTQVNPATPHMSPPQPPSPAQLPQQPSVWPTVIGIILIAVASLGLLTNVCGGVLGLLMPMMMPSEMREDEVFKAQFEVMQRFAGFQIANVVVLLILGVLLLIGGVFILRRRRSGPNLARLWAVGRIIWSVPAAYFTYVVTTETTRAIQEVAANSTQPMPAAMQGLMQAIGPISVAINFVFWCAVPVFVLIWFARRKIRDEIAAWE